jgi:hypothetical protein
MLPDDILLVIFAFYLDKPLDGYQARGRIESWQSLVHVCQRWRRVVFGSPRRLNLRLLCTPETPARMLDVWPDFPLFIWSYVDLPTEGVNNIIAVLERGSDRVSQIDLRGVPSLHLDKVLAVMQIPLPELGYLRFESHDEMVTVLPDSFLGGSAPRLHFLSLDRIPFPGLPKLVLAATHLDTLYLDNIPHSGYFSPEAIVAALSTLTSLELLWLKFQSPRSLPDQANQRPPPQTRSVLPVLTFFEFKGVCEYLDDFVACIDAPRLYKLYITFFNQIEFDTVQFARFISRTPALKALERARLVFGEDAAGVNLSSQTSLQRELIVTIRSVELDWQVSSLEQVCTLSLPPLSTLEDLYINEAPHWQRHWQDNIENTLWLELLRPFATVKNLYLSEQVARRIMPALLELVGGSTTDVLPILQNIFLEQLQPLGPVQEVIGKFVATRQVTGYPIVVSLWDRAG